MIAELLDFVIAERQMDKPIDGQSDPLIELGGRLPSISVHFYSLPSDAHFIKIELFYWKYPFSLFFMIKNMTYRLKDGRAYDNRNSQSFAGGMQLREPDKKE